MDYSNHSIGGYEALENNPSSCCNFEHQCSDYSTNNSEVRAGHFTRNFHGAKEEFVIAKKISNGAPFFLRHSIPEATGFNLFTVGQACLIASMLIFSTTLLNIAEVVSGCKDDEYTVGNVHNNDGAECNLKLWGLVKPSSLMSIIGTVISLGSSLLLPVIGAVIDHTSYRKQVGTWTAFLIVTLNVIQIGVSIESFSVMLITFILLGYLLAVNFCVSEAYLPDLNMDDKEMGSFASDFNIIFYASIFLFLAMVHCVSQYLHLDEIGTCRASQITAVVCFIVFWIYPWKYLFTNRPALHEVPDGKSLISTGFVSVWHTVNDIYQNFPDLGTFVLSLMFLNGALGSLLSISTTFLTDVMRLSYTQVMIVFFTACFSAIPGAVASNIFIKKIGPLQSYRLCVLVWAATTFSVAFVFEGKNEWGHVCTFAAIWGFGYGFKDPIDMSIYTTIIPRGREAEMMGINALSAGALVWAPNLNFTLLNEMDIPMMYCVSSLSAYFLVSFWISLKLPSYQKMAEHAIKYDADHGSFYSRSALSDNDDDCSLSSGDDPSGLDHFLLQHSDV